MDRIAPRKCDRDRSRVSTLQKIPERLQEQDGARKERQRQRDLRDDERFAEGQHAGALDGRNATARLHRVHEIGAREPHRGHEAERETGEETATIVNTTTRQLTAMSSGIVVALADASRIRRRTAPLGDGKTQPSRRVRRA